MGGQESVRGTIIRFSALEEQRDKGLAVKHLPRLFHDDVIVVKTQLDQVGPGNCGMGACHGDNTGLFRQEVVGPLTLGAQEFNRTIFGKFAEDCLDFIELFSGFIHCQSLEPREMPLKREDFHEIGITWMVTLNHIGLECIHPFLHVMEVEVFGGFARVARRAAGSAFGLAAQA